MAWVVELMFAFDDEAKARDFAERLEKVMAEIAPGSIIAYDPAEDDLAELLAQLPPDATLQ